MMRIGAVGLVIVATSLVGATRGESHAAEGTPTAGEEARAVMDAARGASPVLCSLAARSAAGRSGWGWGAPVAAEGADRGVVRWALGERTEVGAIPVLLDGLRGSDRCQQAIAARLLARSDDNAAINGLLAALRSGGLGTRVQAAIGLGMTGDERGSGVLAQAMRDRAWQVRSASVWALGELQDTGVVDELSKLLRSDSSDEVRVAAAQALGRIGNDAGVPALSAGLKDRVAPVRRTSAWGLGQIGASGSATALADAVSDSDEGVREMAVWALGQMEARTGVPALTRALAGDTSVEVRSQAAWALGQIEDRATAPALGRALSDHDAEVRRTAAWALGQIESRDAVPALEGALKDSDAKVRKQAAWALGQIEPHPAPPALVAALGDTSPAVRATVAWALGQIQDPAAAPALAKGLKDRDTGVRRAALWALGQMDSGAARDALLDALKSSDPDMRKEAVRALAGGHVSPWPRPEPRPMPRPFPH